MTRNHSKPLVPRAETYRLAAMRAHHDVLNVTQIRLRLPQGVRRRSLDVLLHQHLQLRLKVVLQAVRFGRVDFRRGEVGVELRVGEGKLDTRLGRAGGERRWGDELFAGCRPGTQTASVWVKFKFQTGRSVPCPCDRYRIAEEATGRGTHLPIDSSAMTRYTTPPSLTSEAHEDVSFRGGIL